MLIPLDLTIDSFRWPGPASGPRVPAQQPYPTTRHPQARCPVQPLVVLPGMQTIRGAISGHIHWSAWGKRCWENSEIDLHYRTSPPPPPPSPQQQQQHHLGQGQWGHPHWKLYLARCTPQTDPHLEVLSRLCSGRSIGHLTRRSLKVSLYPGPQDPRTPGPGHMMTSLGSARVIDDPSWMRSNPSSIRTSQTSLSTIPWIEELMFLVRVCPEIEATQPCRVPARVCGSCYDIHLQGKTAELIQPMV